MSKNRINLLDLFESKRGLDPESELAPHASRLTPNPFAKRFGPCCKDDNARLYWCHKCGKTPGCWDCFIKHKCA